MLPSHTALLMLSLVFAAYSVSSVHARLQGDVLDAFQKSLLQLFGLKSRPSAGKKAVLPQYMVDMYKNRKSEEDNFNTFVRGKGTFPANTVRSFYHSHQTPGVAEMDEDVIERFFFNVTDIPANEELTAADLKLYRQGCSDCDLLTVRIEVHEVIRPPRSNTSASISRLIDVRRVDARKSSWETFDVYPAVVRWKETGDNHGIEVRVVGLDGVNRDSDKREDEVQDGHDRDTGDSETITIRDTGDSETYRDSTMLNESVNVGKVSRDVYSSSLDRLKRIVLNISKSRRKRSSISVEANSSPSNYNVHNLNTNTVKRQVVSSRETARTHVRLRRSADDHNWNSQRPFLVTFSDSLQKAPTRKKRATQSHRGRGKAFRHRSRRKQCKRHPLFVDFAAVGWNDWIIAPSGYDAYFCQGNCRMPLVHYLNTTNHAIVQNIMNEVDPSQAPKACCVPTDLSRVSMLYMDEYGNTVLKSYENMVVEGCGCR